MPRAPDPSDEPIPTPHMQAGARRPRWSRPLLAVAMLPALASCSLFSPLPTDRGQMVEKQDYDKLVPGTTSRADVTALLGSPTSRATFDDNTWYYIGEVTAPVPLGYPRVEQQQVLVLNFNQTGTLQSVRRLDKKDARNVSMVSRTTPSPGSDASFMQQLIGNVGRYNPLGIQNDTLGGTNSFLNSNNGAGHGGAGNSLP